MSPTCASCQFFTKPGDPEYTKQLAYGLCVRFPVEVEHDEKHWCGEYKAKAEPQFKEPAKRK
jgi:hypothetical protein